MSLDIRELTPPQLVERFSLMTGAPMMRGRDNSLMKKLVEDGWLPIQLQYAFLLMKDEKFPLSIPALYKHIDYFAEAIEDELECSVEVIADGTTNAVPFEMLVYRDLKNGGTFRAQHTQKLEEAEAYLRGWCDKHVADITFRSGSQFARSAKR